MRSEVITAPLDPALAPPDGIPAAPRVDHAEITDAMGNLRRAAVKEDPQSVCAAYLEMRKTGRGFHQIDLLELANDAVGEAIMLRWRLASLTEYKPAEVVLPRGRALPAGLAWGLPGAFQLLPDEGLRQVATSSIVGLLANAFSHCSCPMCKDGAVTCDACRGSGLEQGVVCLECDGLGALPCRFCGGTRWVDPAMIPVEFAAEVLKRQRTKTLEDAQRLIKAYQWMVGRGLGLLDRRRRTRLARLTLRLRSRLKNLLPRVDDDQRRPLAAIDAKLAHCARLLASHTPAA